MGHADYYRSGTYNGICDRCGSKFKFSDLKLEWDGLYVCTANGCWEARQPQDYVKGVRDDMSVPVSRPDQPAVYLQNVIANVAAICSFTIQIFRLKLQTLIVNAISVVTLSKIKFAYTNPNVINGSAINTTTLG